MLRAAGIATGLALWASGSVAQAGDAARGARLYLQLPAGLPSCVSCHGPDPAANRNNLLNAAARADVVLRALNTVSRMGYLRDAVDATAREDLAAYLDSVIRSAAAGGRTAWPRSIEFGTLPVGAASPPQVVRLRNLSAQPLPLQAPRLALGLFSLAHDCPDVLAPAAECSATLRAVAAAPTAPGAFTDTLSWPGAVPALVGVSASVRDEPQAVLVADVTGLDFGTAEIGTQVLRRLSLRNAGSAAAELGAATLSGPGAASYALDGGCSPGTVLAPGLSCTAELSFSPGAATAYPATLQWRSDGTHIGTVSLAGGGATVPVTPPVVAPVPPGADGGGGCATTAAARGDAGLLLWLAAAMAALASRARKRHFQMTAV